jgi:uncharacterized protein (TIGR02145 family)
MAIRPNILFFNSLNSTQQNNLNGYRYIRWVITKVRTYSSGVVQAADLVLLKTGTTVSWNPNAIATSPDSLYVSQSEEVQNILDNDSNTKWCNINFADNQIGESTVYIDNITPIDFDCYYYVTANDEEVRDPISWTLSVSNDNINWTVVSTVTDAEITESRFTSTDTFCTILGPTPTPTPTPVPTDTPTPTPTSTPTPTPTPTDTPTPTPTDTPTPTPTDTPTPTPVPTDTPTPTSTPTNTPTPTPTPNYSQCASGWTLVNLNVTTYRNGDPIPEVTGNTEWSGLTTGAWCYFNHDSNNGPILGKLYNWYAVNDPRGLAPEGYHIPTQSEWLNLINCAGGLSTAGGELKQTGTTYWNSPNVGATNSTNFSVLGAGFRSSTTGSFGGLLNSSSFWTSNEQDSLNALSYVLSDNSTSVSLSVSLKGRGFSVRLIQDP